MTSPERQLYRVSIYRRNSRQSEMTTHLDLQRDERKMHGLIIDAMRTSGYSIDDIGYWRLEVQEVDGRQKTLMSYGTTAEPGDEEKLRR